MTDSTPVRSTTPRETPRQVRPRTEGWTQKVDAEGKPLLQFAAPKKGMPPAHLADMTPEQRV
ncbi:MAG: 23S rRNA (adenine(2503)-C(2))-methyltransferase RlmN, partial [Microbacterium sp.]